MLSRGGERARFSGNDRGDTNRPECVSPFSLAFRSEAFSYDFEESGVRVLATRSFPRLRTPRRRCLRGGGKRRERALESRTSDLTHLFDDSTNLERCTSFSSSRLSSGALALVIFFFEDGADGETSCLM